MSHGDLLTLLLPNPGRDGAPGFDDLTGRATARAVDCHTLEITADFPAALVRFDVELRAGAFDFDTLYCEMTEYPSGRFVKTGPWDVSMDPPVRMQVPTLDVHWRGEQFGQLWFEMPSPDDLREKRLGGVFALPFYEAPGRHTVRLEVPGNERGRLHFGMVERITVRLDSREVPNVSPVARDPSRPWLFLGDLDPAKLSSFRTGLGRFLWETLSCTVNVFLSGGSPPARGMPLLLSAGFVALAEGEGDESGTFARLLALLEARRRDDAFLDGRGKYEPLPHDRRPFAPDKRWLMGHGWNDYGFSWVLLQHAGLYQWLGPRLPTGLRAWLRAGLVRYGREAYRFLVFQRQYGGAQGAVLQNHATVPILAVTAVGAVLRGECGEAARWLDFALGRIRETMDLMGEGLVAPNAIAWDAIPMYQLVELWRAVTGEDHRDLPYFKAAPEALWRHHDYVWPEGFPIIRYYYRRLAAACYGSQLGDAASRWYWHRLRSEEKADGGISLPASYLDVIWRPADGGKAPPPEARDRSSLFPDVSYAVLQTNHERPRLALTVQAGPFGRKGGPTLESYNGAYHGMPAFHAGYEVWGNGLPILRNLTSYRQSFQNGNFVTVDGDGFLLDGAYLPGRMDMTRVPRLLAADIGERAAFLDILMTRSYRSDLGIAEARRRIWFDATLESALILDEVSGVKPHDYALLLHAAEFTALGGGCFRARGQAGDGARGESPLFIRVACTASSSCRVVMGSLVLTYASGVTRVKGGPKLSGEMRGYGPSVDRRMVCRVRGRRRAVRFATFVSTREFDVGSIDWLRRGEDPLPLVEIFVALAKYKGGS